MHSILYGTVDQGYGLSTTFVGLKYEGGRNHRVSAEDLVGSVMGVYDLKPSELTQSDEAGVILMPLSLERRGKPDIANVRYLGMLAECASLKGAIVVDLGMTTRGSLEDKVGCSAVAHLLASEAQLQQRLSRE